MTPLHMAASQGRHATVQYLVKTLVDKGDSIDIKDDNGVSLKADCTIEGMLLLCFQFAHFLSNSQERVP